MRMAVALSILKHIPVRIFNIRLGRSNPGLSPQHLKGKNVTFRIIAVLILKFEISLLLINQNIKLCYLIGFHFRNMIFECHMTNDDSREKRKRMKTYYLNICSHISMFILLKW